MSIVEDTVDAIKRGGRALKDKAGSEIERIKRKERQRRITRIAVLVGVAYFLLRR